MAFIVEDGTGVLGATSYTDVQFFRDYHTDRGTPGTDIGSLPDTDVEVLLIKGTTYIDTRFGAIFRGQIFNQFLNSRSILTFTAQPIDSETVTVGAVIYTFKTTPTEGVATDVEIGSNLAITLNNLVGALSAQENEDLLGSRTDSIDQVVIFTARDGVVTAESGTTMSFDNPTSTGFSPLKQPLEFPRRDLFDHNSGIVINGIPEELKEATVLYAFKSNSTTLMPDPVINESGLKVTGDRTKVGPIETDVEFSGFGQPRNTRPYPEADFLISLFTDPANRTIRA